MQQPTTYGAACADTSTQKLSTYHSIPTAALSSVTEQTETPFLLLPLHFIVSSLGLISALLDSGTLNNFISSTLVHELQDQGTQLEI